MSNLTRLKRLTEELNNRDRQIRENEQLLRLALDAADAGAWVWDIEKDEVKASKKFLELFNTSISKFEDFLNCLHPDDVTKVQSAVKEAIENRVDYNVHYRIKCPNGWKNIHSAGSVDGSTLSGICIQEAPCQCRDDSHV